MICSRERRENQRRDRNSLCRSFHAEDKSRNIAVLCPAESQSVPISRLSRIPFPCTFNFGISDVTLERPVDAMALIRSIHVVIRAVRCTFIRSFER